MKLPQKCPHCQVSLVDRDAPAEHRDQFSLVLMDAEEFQCPVCKGTWRRGPLRRKRSGNPAR